MNMAIQGEGGHVDSCSFIGAAGGAATWLSSDVALISNSRINGCVVVADSSWTTITGCTFETNFTSDVPSILVEASNLAVIGCIFNNAWTGGAIAPLEVGSPWSNVSIVGNQFYGGFVDLGSGPIAGLVIADNQLYGLCDLIYNPGATARIVRDVSIHGNNWSEVYQSSRATVHFLGTALYLENISIIDNIISSTNPTALTSCIDLQISRDLDDNGQGIRIAGNTFEFFNGDDGYAIRVRGRAGATHGHVFVESNMLRAASVGILIEDVRDVVVSNNVQGVSDDVQNQWNSNQLTVRGADTAVVDGNKWIAGEAGDWAGTGAVISVDASRSGAVRNNDIWGKEVGAMNTALKYSAGLVESGNVYHGLHSLQTGSVLTNGIVGQASGSGTGSAVFTGTATGAVV